MSPLNHGFSSRSDQRGAIGLIAAGTLSMALLCMLVVLDSGRLYLEKRSLQRVADVSALEVASRKGTCAAGTAIAYATQSAARNGFTIGDDGRTLTTTCGKLTVGADNRRVFGADPTQSSAIQVVVTHSVPRSIAAGIGAMFDSTPQPLNIQLSAVAVAAVTPPVAALTIRSTLLSVDTQKSAILNALFSGLLGGNVSLDVVGWNGLVNTNVSLLSYLDQLKINLNLTAVGYDQVLTTDVTVNKLVQAAIDVLTTSGTAGIDVAIASLKVIQAAAGSTSVVLGNLLQVNGGTETAGLSTNLNVFQLIEGFVQLANKKNGLVASQNINLGLITLSTKIQVLEPAQLSAIGNPALAMLDPLGPNRIYVKTAQIRTLVSVALPVANDNPLVKGLSNAIGGILQALACVLGCDMPSVQLLPSPRIDVALAASSGESYVTNYSCASNTKKSLSTTTNTSLVTLQVGQIDPTTVFTSNTDPTAVALTPLPILDIGRIRCTLLAVCGPRTPSVGGGIGLSLNSTGNSAYQSQMIPYTFNSPNLPEINQPPAYHSYTSGVGSTLSGVVSGIQIAIIKPSYSNPIGNLLYGIGTVLNDILSSLATLIQSVLGPLIDTLTNILFSILGIDLNKVDVGANLSCNLGQATLVI